MALTSFPSSIGRESNPQPSNCEPSTLPLDHSFRFAIVKDHFIRPEIRDIEMGGGGLEKWVTYYLNGPFWLFSLFSICIAKNYKDFCFIFIRKTTIIDIDLGLSNNTWHFISLF